MNYLNLKCAALLLLLLALTNGISQNKPVTDLVYNGLKGLVHKIHSTVYDVADSNGQVIKKWSYTHDEIFNGSGNLISSAYNCVKKEQNDMTRYYYDLQQNLVAQEEFGPGSVLKTGTYTVYDVAGKIIKETEKELYLDDEDLMDTSITIKTYKYNSSGKVSEIWSSNNQEDGTFSPPRRYIAYTYPDTSWSKVRYEYCYKNKPDSANIEYLQFNKNGKTVRTRNSQSYLLNEYDKAGRLVKISSLNPEDGSLVCYDMLTYDKFGNQNSTTCYDQRKKAIRYTLKSDYQNMDPYKNWLRVKSYKNGQWLHYCEREIEYYQ